MSFFNTVGVSTFPNQQLQATLTDGQMNTVNLVGAQTVRFDISGTWIGTVFFEASSDGIVYQTVQLLPFGPLLASQTLSQSSVSSTTQNGSWFGSIAGMDSFRLRASLVSGSVVTFNQISQAVSTLDVFEHADGFVDTHSSTTTPLGSNGVFTGPATDMLPFTAVRLSIFTDQPSAVSTGLSIQWSGDGTNWDFQQNTGIPASSAGGGVHMVFGRISRYFRVVYTNGATPQTAFRMQVIHQRVTPPVASSFINQILTDGDTAATVKAVLAAKNPSGVYVPISCGSGGVLKSGSPSVTQTGNLVTTGDTVVLSTEALSTITMEVSGTFTGTLVVESQDTPTSPWRSDSVTQFIGTAANAFSPSITTPGTWYYLGTGLVSNFRLRANPMTSGTAVVSLSGTATFSSIIQLSDPSFLNITATLGNSFKTVIGKTGTLVTTATTADQVLLTYTVTTGKTFYLQDLQISGYVTALPNADSPALLGNSSLESPAGAKLITDNLVYGLTQSLIEKGFAEPLPFASGTVVRVVVTPAATTSFTWRANFLGYEK